MFSKLTGASFPKQRTIYSTDCYSHFLELKAQNAFISLPQRKASFGRFESTPSQLTSTSHLECIINSRVGTCCFLTVLISLPNQTRQVSPSALAILRGGGSSWKIRVVLLFNTLTAFYRIGTRRNLCPFFWSRFARCQPACYKPALLYSFCPKSKCRWSASAFLSSSRTSYLAEVTHVPAQLGHK